MNLLTIEYLKEINAEPLKHWIWIEILLPEKFRNPISGYYRTSSDYTNGEAFCCGWPGIGYHFEYSDYGISWTAYKINPHNDSKNKKGDIMKAILEMDMPESCRECLLFGIKHNLGKETDYYCKRLGEKYQMINVNKERAPFCPLKPKDGEGRH